MVSKFVEDKDGIFNIQFSFFLQLLHSSDDFSGETSDFEFFILLDIEQNTKLNKNYMTFYPPMASCSLILSTTNF